MNQLLFILFFSAWYIGLCFFFWILIWSPLKTGEAGTSGVRLIKNQSPVRFWISVTERNLILLGMAILPLLNELPRSRAAKYQNEFLSYLTPMQSIEEIF